MRFLALALEVCEDSDRKWVPVLCANNQDKPHLCLPV